MRRSPLSSYSMFTKRRVEDGAGRAAHTAARAVFLDRYLHNDPDPDEEPDE